MTVAGQEKTIIFHTGYAEHGMSFWDYSGPDPYDTWPLENLFGRIETMYPFIFIAGEGSEQGGVATPHPDDIAIFSTLYPAPGRWWS